MNVPPASEPETDTNPRPSFEELSREKEPGLLVEFWMFIKENKLWWMIPLLLVLGLLGVAAYLTQTGAMPFIYPF
jgi:hypothetical protein